MTKYLISLGIRETRTEEEAREVLGDPGALHDCEITRESRAYESAEEALEILRKKDSSVVNMGSYWVVRVWFIEEYEVEEGEEDEERGYCSGVFAVADER